MRTSMKNYITNSWQFSPILPQKTHFSPNGQKEIVQPLLPKYSNDAARHSLHTYQWKVSNSHQISPTLPLKALFCPKLVQRDLRQPLSCKYYKDTAGSPLYKHHLSCLSWSFSRSNRIKIKKKFIYFFNLTKQGLLCIVATQANLLRHQNLPILQ